MSGVATINSKSTAATPAAIGASAMPIPRAVLDTIAERFRPAELFTLMCRSCDAAVEYHDASAAPFFMRYLLPQCQAGNASFDLFRSAISKINLASEPTMIRAFAGIAMVAFPCIEKRQMVGVVVLAARSDTFANASDEDVQRTCNRLKLDSGLIFSLAKSLPGYGADALFAQAGIAQLMTRDQLRLTSMEGELVTLSSQLSNTYEELSLIYTLSGGMKVNRQANDFFKQACLDVMEVMQVRGMGVALDDEHFADCKPAVYGETALPPELISTLARQLIAALADRKAPLLIHHLDRDDQFSWLAPYATQMLAVPLMRQDHLLGCLFGFDKQDGEFDSIDSKLLNSIANETAIYLENSMLFEDVHGLMMGLLHSLTSAVDAKDAYTCGHSERVALISKELAHVAGYSDEFAERVYMAGLLHDVGKIGVPEAVLRKAGKLDDEEFAQIKKHPEIGAKILSDIKKVEDIIPGVMSHHERYDGAGYPQNLAGEAIPIFGRIICLADCFDAMTSSRTYRKALPLSTALTEIKKCAGTQFDPILAEKFLCIGEARLGELLRMHQEQSDKESLCHASKIAEQQHVEKAA